MQISHSKTQGPKDGADFHFLKTTAKHQFTLQDHGYVEQCNRWYSLLLSIKKRLLAKLTLLADYMLRWFTNLPTINCPITYKDQSGN